MLNRQFRSIYWFIKSIWLAWYCSSAVMLRFSSSKTTSKVKFLPTEWTHWIGSFHICRFSRMSKFVKGQIGNWKVPPFMELHLISSFCAIGRRRKAQDVSIIFGNKIATLWKDRKLPKLRKYFRKLMKFSHGPF